MRKICFAMMVVAISLAGCKNGEKGAAHVHETEEAHVHEGHSHEEESEEEHARFHREGETAEEHALHAAGESAGEGHGDEIVFTREQAARTTFEVREVVPGRFREVIEATGQVLEAPGDESVVVAGSEGVVSFARRGLAEGMTVKGGEVLFHVASRDVKDGDYYTRVRSEWEAARAEFERAGELVEDRIVSRKEYEEARAAYERARAAYEAVEGRYSERGMAATAPAGGYVKSVAVREGEYVTVGQPLAVVARNERLVLRAEVSERHYGALGEVRTASFRTPYDDRVHEVEALGGRLLAVGRNAGETGFYVPVTFEMEAGEGVVPGSFVEVFLEGRELEGVLTVPVSALTEELGTFYVYVQVDEECYRKQEVALGASNGREVLVRSGLRAGDRVVTRGAYQVKMAGATGTIPHGHSHAH